MATQTLEELLVLINASTDKLREELTKGDKQVKRFGSSVNRSLDQIDGRFSRLTSSIRNTVGTLTAGLTFALLVRQVNATARSLEEASRQAASLGTSVEAIQELTFTFREFDLESNDVSDALGTLADRAQDAQDGMKSFIDDFKLLGIEVADLRGKRPEELLELVAERVAAIEDPTKRTAGIVRIFGDDLGRRLQPLLLQGSRGLQQYADRWRELGVIVNEEGAEASRAAAEQIRELQSVLEGKFTRLVSDNAQEIAAIADALIRATDATIRFVGAVARAGRAATDNEGIKLELQDDIAQLEQLRELVQQGLGAFRFEGNIRWVWSDEDRQALIREIDDRLELYRHALNRRITDPPVRTDTGPDPADFRSLDAAARSASGAVLKAREALAKFHDEQRRVNEAVREFHEKRELEERVKSVARSVDESSDVLDEVFKRQDEAAKKAEDAVRDLGLTFESAFENAIIEGEKLSDVLRALLKDIIRIAARQTLINPFAGFLTSFFPVPGKASGGPYRKGQPFAAGERGTEIIFPDVSGRVMTAAQSERMMRAGGAGGVSQEFNFGIAFPPQLESFVRNVAGPAGRDAAIQVLRAREGRL